MHCNLQERSSLTLYICIFIKWTLTYWEHDTHTQKIKSNHGDKWKLLNLAFMYCIIVAYKRVLVHLNPDPLMHFEICVSFFFFFFFHCQYDHKVYVPHISSFHVYRTRGRFRLQKRIFFFRGSLTWCQNELQPSFCDSCVHSWSCVNSDKYGWCYLEVWWIS